MKVLVDENIPGITVRALQALGHDVKDLRGTCDQGLSDDLLWEVAVSEKRLLITTDKGFARIRSERHPGVLVIRLRQPNRLRIHQRVLDVLQRMEAVKWPGAAVVARDQTWSVWRPESGRH